LLRLQRLWEDGLFLFSLGKAAAMRATPSIAALFFLVLTAACTSAVASNSSSPKLTFYGYGPVKAGMTIKEAERASGRSFGWAEPLGDCVRYRPEGIPRGVSWLAKGGRLRVVEVRGNAAIRTKERVHVGSSISEVRKAYRAYSTRQIEQDGRLIMSVRRSWHGGDKHEIVFSIVDGRVVSIEAGDFSGMGEIERCL
jgi:hypothetical protein